MGFSMNRPSMSISYGGESNKQQKSNLMKDNPVAKHASAMHMAGKNESPTEFNKGLKKASKDGKLDKNPEFKAKVDASGINMNKPKGEKPGSPAKQEKTKLTAAQKAYLDRTNKAMKKRAAEGKGHTHTSPKGGVPNPPVKKYKK